jgi:hypothetical protein
MYARANTQTHTHACALTHTHVHAHTCTHPYIRITYCRKHVAVMLCAYTGTRARNGSTRTLL